MISDNAESLLEVSDLVFIDPIGTGFSRLIEEKNAKDDKTPGDAHDPNEYFSTARDLAAMCEFIGRWLSDHGRWGSPIFIAGESYGGYRAGRGYGGTNYDLEHGYRVASAPMHGPARYGYGPR